MISEIEHRQRVSTSTFTCEICIEPVYSNKRFKNNKPCSHNSYCSDCIAHYIQAQLEEFNTANIRCPGSDCNQTLDPLTCRPILSSPKVFERWCDALCEWRISGKGYYRSYCPFPDCSTAFFANCKNFTMATCTTCKRRFCFRCKVPWEFNHDCFKYQKREGIDDTQFEALARRNKWARCPGCDYVIELTSGCSIVLCRCGTTFCYESGKIVNDFFHCPCAECGRKAARRLRCAGRVFRLFIIIALIIVYALVIWWIVRRGNGGGVI